MIGRIQEPDIQLAVDLLRAGKLVAIPTETVYGLAADATNEKAVRRIFEVKGRPIGHPLIVHVADYPQLLQWAVDIPQSVSVLTEHFWPGPLTIVLKRAPQVLDIITGGQETVALRSPGHPIAQEILREFGGGLAVPSANRFGHISPTRAEHVLRDLGDQVDLIVDGGPCEVGVESTILDLSTSQPRLLRPGMLNHEVISEFLGEPVILGHDDQLASATPRVSGSLPSHYAPTTPTVLVPSAKLRDFVEAQSKNKKLGVLARKSISAEKINPKSVRWITLPKDPEGYAQNIYKEMRELDALNYDMIVIEAVPENSSWLAINDRLQRGSRSKL